MLEGIMVRPLEKSAGAMNRLYDYERPDELRRPWNDQMIVPKNANREERDPRRKEPRDKLHLPFR